jgi:tripartite-type tricarboxylate transporter receptor subunit TctC
MHPVVLSFLASIALALAAPAGAQTYPAKPVRIIVGTSPGATPDVFARYIAQKMSESWGPVLVENRVGATGSIAAELVAKSAPDGYTAYIAESAIWGLNPHLFKRLPYDPLRDFAPVTTIAGLPTFLTLHQSVPARSYAEFIAYAKANPGKLSYASSGNGSIHHITTELFKSLAGVDVVHIPYKGMGLGAQALIAGDVQLAFTSYTSVAPHVKSGKLRMLAASTAQRMPALPDLPTVVEFGYPGFDMVAQLGALMPAGAPREVVAKFREGVVAAVASPDVRDKMLGFGTTVGTSTPEQFGALMKAEYEKYAGLVKLSGAKMD